VCCSQPEFPSDLRYDRAIPRMRRIQNQSSKLTRRNWFLKRAMTMSANMMHPMRATLTQVPRISVVMRAMKVIPSAYRVRYLFIIRTGDDWDELERKAAKCDYCFATKFSRLY
jgi:hypothetical protein